MVFCAMGFLASVGLLCWVWRRCFPEIGVGVVAAGALALGLAGFTPIICHGLKFIEVAISCGYALTMLALLALWGAAMRPHQRGRWLAAASLAYGLAIGARPNLLFGAVILLVPVAQAWREGRRIWAPLLAATGPITCIGLGLMLYNTLRFDNPFEFGMYYQLISVRMATALLESALPWIQLLGLLPGAGALGRSLSFRPRHQVATLAGRLLGYGASLWRPDQHSCGLANGGRAAGLAWALGGRALPSARVPGGGRLALRDSRLDSWLLLRRLRAL